VPFLPSQALRLGAAAAIAAMPLAVRAAAAQVPAPATADTAQRDVMDIVARILGRKRVPRDSTAPPPKALFTILPTISADPTVGLLFGVSGDAVTRLGPPGQTNTTVLTASIGYSTKSQFHTVVRSNVFSSKNRIKLEGDWRYLDTSQPTYGLGPALPVSARANMDFNLLRLYETVYLGVARGTFVGVGYHLDRHFDIIDLDAALRPTPFLEYNGGRTVTSTTSSGFSLDALYDTRDNPINPTRGALVAGRLAISPTWLGSDTSWQSLQGEARLYPILSRQHRQILALWAFAWLSFGHAPYLDLPAIGADYNNRTGRGYPQGRIRGTDLLYAEAEYRVTLSANGLWGAVAFVNLTSASALGSRELPAPDLGAGLGLRVKLNKRSGANLTVDYGFGAEGSRGLFLGTGEAF
jgi:outer membrane protein assembly factor BamA